MLSENEWQLSSKSLSVMIRCKIRMKLPQRVQRELRDASPDFRCLPPAVGLQLRLPPSSLSRCFVCLSYIVSVLEAHRMGQYAYILLFSH